MENNKMSQLVFDARIARKLLKNNGEIKYCPFCGTLMSNGCSCNKNIIIDIKKKRGSDNESVFVFDNNKEFQFNYNEIISEEKPLEESIIPD